MKSRQIHADSDSLERLEALRHAGGRLGGPTLGGPFGGRGRKRRGDVRIAILLLLAEEPRNGYQLMGTIEERSSGNWRPSPGSVYPTLAHLEDEGLIRATDRDAVKLFEITDLGRKRLLECGGESAPWEMDNDPATVADLKDQLRQIHVAAIQVAHAGTEEQVARGAGILADARRSLYRILAEDEDA